MFKPGLLRSLLHFFLRLCEALLSPLLAALARLPPLHGWGRRRARTLQLAARIPGPPPWPLLGNLTDMPADGDEAVATLLRYRRLYGDVIRVWMGPVLLVCLFHPADYEAVFTHVPTAVHKGSAARVFRLATGSGVIAAVGAQWRSQRRAVQPGFGGRAVERSLPAVRRHADAFLSLLAGRADGRSFDISPLVDRLALDIICEAAMGVNLGVQTEASSEYTNALKRAKMLAVQRVWQPWLYADWLFRLLPGGRQCLKHVAVLHRARNKVVSERQRERKRAADSGGDRRHLCLLDLLLDNPEMDQSAINSEVDTFLVTGQDTISYALSFALYQLAANPQVQERAVSELRAVFGDLSASSSIQPGPSQLSQLLYLDRVVRETLRMHMPVPVSTREAQSDLTLPSGGHTVPAGTLLLLLPQITQNLPEYFPDPDRFDPDRWLPENSRDRHPYSFIPFGAGPRNCVGKRLALMELKAVLAAVLSRYRLLPQPGFRAHLAFALTSQPRDGVRLRLLPRA